MKSCRAGIFFCVLLMSSIFAGCTSNQNNEQVNLESQTEINDLSIQLNESLSRIEQLTKTLDRSNNSNQMLEMQIDILQISLDLEKQNSMLQSISHNATLSDLQNSIISTQELLAEANSIISQYESIDCLQIQISITRHCYLKSTIILASI